MNLTRLVALSLLENGTQHGHQIRRYAELTAAGRWGGVNVRSLPRELRQLEEDGLVALVRTEQIVHRPERRIYEITDSGRQELHILREQAMGELHTSPDPLAVALVFATVADPSEPVLWLQRRRQALAVELATLGAERVRLEGHGHLRSLQAAVMRRAEAAMAADIAWHDELNQTLNASGPGGPAVIPGGAQM